MNTRPWRWASALLAATFAAGCAAPPATFVAPHRGSGDLGLARDPAAGIYYGTRYLNSKLQAYPGDTASAVAAYNAGTARRGASGAFINQDYVNKVLGFWRQYRGAAPAAPARKPGEARTDRGRAHRRCGGPA